MKAPEHPDTMQDLQKVALCLAPHLPGQMGVGVYVGQGDVLARARGTAVVVPRCVAVRQTRTVCPTPNERKAEV